MILIVASDIKQKLKTEAEVYTKLKRLFIIKSLSLIVDR